MTSASNIKQFAPPSLTDLLNINNKEVQKDINCVQIGQIVSFDATKQTASIQIVIKKILEEKLDGTRVLEEYPIILDCPVFFLFGGAAFLSMPVQAGDNCLVLFNDREIDNWFTNGGLQAPSSFRTHDLSDAFALVGIKNMQTKIADYLTNGIRLSYNANSRLSITNGAIDTIAALFTQTGDMRVEGDLSAQTIHADNGATGTFNIVTVVDGIVISGS